MSRQARQRRGFTTIELLVVISIIAVLSGLLYVGISSVRSREAVTTTKKDIELLALALEAFKTQFGEYPPSRITVSNDANTLKAADMWSFTKLNKFWPDFDFAGAFGPGGMDITNGNAAAKMTYVVKGHQCLVLFLGGRHDANGCQGFSDTVTIVSVPTPKRLRNPFAAANAGTQQKVKPFFEFKANRLYRMDQTKPFYAYSDGWARTFVVDATTGTSREEFPCYAYFKARDPKQAPSTQDIDCDTLTDIYNDYPKPFRHTSQTDAQGNYVWVNPNSFQLISPGKDTFWGAANRWAPGDTSDVSANPRSMDNIANFSNGLLGQQ